MALFSDGLFELKREELNAVRFEMDELSSKITSGLEHEDEDTRQKIGRRLAMRLRLGRMPVEEELLSALAASSAASSPLAFSPRSPFAGPYRPNSTDCSHISSSNTDQQLLGLQVAQQMTRQYGRSFTPPATSRTRSDFVGPCTPSPVSEEGLVGNSATYSRGTATKSSSMSGKGRREITRGVSTPNLRVPPSIEANVGIPSSYVRAERTGNSSGSRIRAVSGYKGEGKQGSRRGRKEDEAFIPHDFHGDGWEVIELSEKHFLHAAKEKRKLEAELTFVRSEMRQLERELRAERAERKVLEGEMELTNERSRMMAEHILRLEAEVAGSSSEIKSEDKLWGQEQQGEECGYPRYWHGMKEKEEAESGLMGCQRRGIAGERRKESDVDHIFRVMADSLVRLEETKRQLKSTISRNKLLNDDLEEQKKESSRLMKVLDTTVRERDELADELMAFIRSDNSQSSDEAATKGTDSSKHGVKDSFPFGSFTLVPTAENQGGIRTHEVQRRTDEVHVAITRGSDRRQLRRCSTEKFASPVSGFGFEQRRSRLRHVTFDIHSS